MKIGYRVFKLDFERTDFVVRERFKTKLTKKQKRNNCIVFLTVLIFLYIFTLLFGYGIDLFENEPLAEVLLQGFFLIFFISSMLLFPVLSAAVALGVQKGKAQRVFDNATYISLQSIAYYRDTLSELNPALVSLLMDLDIYGEKVLAATLLRMQNKQVISFEKKGGIAIIATSKKGLDNSEKGLLNMIENKCLNNKKMLRNWKQACFLEAERSGYIRKKKHVTKSVKEETLPVLATIICTFLAIVLWRIFLETDMIERIDFFVGAITIFGYLLLIDILIFVPWYIAIKRAVYYKREDVIWERTPLGDETTEKIAGLSRFIQEFSLLSEAKKEQVVLWDDYLVYALVLEKNEKIVKNISQLYKGVKQFKNI